MKLNLGCGSQNLAGYVNVDQPIAVSKHDQSVDLEQLPWPWDDNSIDEVAMWCSLEHLTFADQKIREVHRILKPGGVFVGAVPYVGSHDAFQALDHRSFFTEKSFDTVCGISGYDALGHGEKPLFKAIYIRLDANGDTTLKRIRNMIPCRKLIRHFLWNMYDGVSWRMVKL